jgi:hypothetical protein
MSVDHQDIEQKFILSELIQEHAKLRESLGRLSEVLDKIAGARQVPTTLDRDQVAQLLHVAPGTVDNWVSRRKIPFRKANGSVFFLLDELLDWTKPAPRN